MHAWQPWIADLFGFRPGDMSDLYVHHVDAMISYLEQKNEAARG